MRSKSLVFTVQAAAIAAIYVVLTLVFAPISFGPIQVRVAEALTVLPFFTPAAVPGLFVGCLLGNIVGGAVLPDILFGSLATLIGAVGSYLLRRNKFLVPLPPILANAAIVPLVLKYAYGVGDAYPFLLLTITVGEVLSCGVAGEILLNILNPHKNAIFRQELISGKRER
jgi:uncharacterized membrane protein